MCSQNKILGIDVDVLYQVEALKEDHEELEENYRLVEKELKSKTRQHESLKRDHKELEQEMASQRTQFEQHYKDQEEAKQKLELTVQQLTEELEGHKKLIEESEKARLEAMTKQEPVADVALARETSKQTREYHYKWKMAEQENSVLQTAVQRLENSVVRYKESLKEAESVEANLKAEKRKLLRELRDAECKVEELETNNSHLQKRLDRIRSRNLLTGGDTSLQPLSTPTATPTASLASPGTTTIEGGSPEAP